MLFLGQNVCILTWTWLVMNMFYCCCVDVFLWYILYHFGHNGLWSQQGISAHIAHSLWDMPLMFAWFNKVSQMILINNHQKVSKYYSYLDHGYPGDLVYTSWLQTPRSAPGLGWRGNKSWTILKMLFSSSDFNNITCMQIAVRHI